jgi:PadR family transcriptional regulator, regulatory protein PadR
MVRNRALSPAARGLLGILFEAGPRWSHGYALGRQAGIQSGTLYPLLIRLEAQGLLEAEWQPPESGRPPRHGYRLTAAGQAVARDLAAEATAASAGRPA